MTPKLREAARTINELVKKEDDTRLALCKAIAAAMDLVRKESNLPWREWADANLRKPDGSKWSSWTLYSYASFGRNPKKLEHVRKAIAQNGQNARKALRVAKQAMSIPQQRPPSGMILERQVESLMFAWRNASSEARKVFLEKISKDQADVA